MHTRHLDAVPVKLLSNIKEIFRQSKRLGLVAFIMSMSASIPKFVLESSEGFAELGTFSAYNSISAGFLAIASGIGQPLISPLANQIRQKNKKKFTLITLFLQGVAISFGTLMFLCLNIWPDFINNLYRGITADAPSIRLLFSLMIASQMSALFLWYAATAAGQLKRQVLVSFFSLITVMVASLTIIPNRGLSGVLSACVVSSIVEVFLLSTCILPFLRESSPKRHARL